MRQNEKLYPTGTMFINAMEIALNVEKMKWQNAIKGMEHGTYSREGLQVYTYQVVDMLQHYIDKIRDFKEGRLSPVDVRPSFIRRREELE